MKKLLNIFIVFFFCFAFLDATKQTYAASNCVAPKSGLDITLPEYPVTKEHTITIDMSSGFDDTRTNQLTIGGTYVGGSFNGALARSVGFRSNQNIQGSSGCNADGCITITNGVVTWVIKSQRALSQSAIQGSIDEKPVYLYWGHTDGDNYCNVGSFSMSDVTNPGSGCTVEVYQNRNGEQCYLNQSGSACFEDGTPINVRVSDLKDQKGDPWKSGWNVGLNVYEKGWRGEVDGGNGQVNGGAANISFTPTSNDDNAEYVITVEDREWTNEKFPNCSFTITTSKTGCNSNECLPQITLEIGGAANAVAREAFSLCKQIPEDQVGQRSECEDCTGGTGEFENNEGVWTAIGCIKSDPQSIMQKFISVGLGISGGVALLTFLAAGFIFSTSQGDPKAYGKAKEMMTSSIIGIIFVIFSVTLLQFIGYEILKIPGFGGL